VFGHSAIAPFCTGVVRVMIFFVENVSKKCYQQKKIQENSSQGSTQHKMKMKTLPTKRKHQQEETSSIKSIYTKNTINKNDINKKRHQQQHHKHECTHQKQEQFYRQEK